ncbi:MAG TPA: macro domain-containing protein [Candidatus Limnocylindrales bacterium]|jgi:O-acetyl-ADP-ribose deacetylase|nr:macro domain-containing protein [Candidatus Limnocylindrales bacterium]
MAAPIEIDVWQGDIAELEVDALVVSANESLFMTTGPAASVKRHGGEEIERAAVEQGPIAAGSAVVTPAGSLAAGYVIHTVAVGHDRAADAMRLQSALRAALALAAPLQLRRIAVALVGVEFGVFSAEEAAQQLVEAIAAAGAPLESVVLATATPAETRAVSAALAAHRATAR